MRRTLSLAAATLLLAMPAFAPTVLAEPAYGLVPPCGDAAALASGLAQGETDGYADTICADPEMLARVKRIQEEGDALAAKLPAYWRPAFEAQQKAFPRTASSCPPPPGLAACLGAAVVQRVDDIATLDATLAAPPPDCKPAEIEVRDTDISDAGMSKGTAAYLFRYRGTQACVIRGYPAIKVEDAAGAPIWTAAAYGGSAAYVDFPGPPLPVTLTARSPSAFFTLSTSVGCDAPDGKAGLLVSVALPLSQMTLRTLSFEGATCRQVTVTPVGPLSMMRAAVR